MLHRFMIKRRLFKLKKSSTLGKSSIFRTKLFELIKNIAHKTLISFSKAKTIIKSLKILPKTLFISFD